jgi:hypothetical protein
VFEGVTDYFQHNGGTVLNGVNQFNDEVAWTFACWMYWNTTPSNYFVGDDGATQSHLGMHADGYLLFRSEGQDHFRWTTTALEDDTWYRVVIVASTDTTLIAYVNGVQYGSTLTASSTAFDGSNPTLTAEGGTKLEFTGWGMPYESSGTRGSAFDGMMSDGQVWDAAWTADDVLYDYNNPEQLALNRGGTSLTNSNLKVWYPMNDGHRGQQSFILDASDVTPPNKNHATTVFLGDELITSDYADNGTFTNDNGNWAVHDPESTSGVAITSWDATFGNGGDNGGLKVNISDTSAEIQGVKLAKDYFETLVAGRTYRVSK